MQTSKTSSFLQELCLSYAFFSLFLEIRKDIWSATSTAVEGKFREAQS